MFVLSGLLLAVFLYTQNFAFFAYITDVVATGGLLANSFLGPASTLAERVIFHLILNLWLSHSDPHHWHPGLGQHSTHRCHHGPVDSLQTVAAPSPSQSPAPSSTTNSSRPCWTTLRSLVRTLLDDPGIQALYPDLARYALVDMIEALSDAFTLAMRFLIFLTGVP
ncbi:hypothetical protein HK405_000194, partial [Cladochytrium tenue]